MPKTFYTVTHHSTQFGGLISNMVQKHYELKEGALAAYNRLKQEYEKDGYTIENENTENISAFSAEIETLEVWCYFVSVKEQRFE